jgi:hypothetical protein
MNIIINGKEEAYSLLYDPSPFSSEPRGAFPKDDWKKEKDLNTQTPFGFNFGPIELPEPFESATLNFARFQEHYRISMIFCSRDNLAFQGASRDLVAFFRRKNRNYGFIPTTPHATGYIVNPENSVLAAIMDVGENLEKRLVALGSHGAEPLRFSDEPNFQQQLRLLEEVGDTFFNGCIFPLVRDRKIKKLPDLMVNLNP